MNTAIVIAANRAPSGREVLARVGGLQRYAAHAAAVSFTFVSKPDGDDRLAEMEPTMDPGGGCA